DAQPGETVSPISAGGGFTRTGIATIVDMESREIEVDVNEAYINRVRDGQRVEAVLDAYPDWKLPGRVISIVPTADRQKATVRVRVGFEQLDPRILPDMGIKVAFLENDEPQAVEQEPRQDIAIPVSAVLRGDGNTEVFVVSDNRARRRAVELEARSDRDYWVTAGLSPGEHYVVNPPSTLEDGAVVTVE